MFATGYDQVENDIKTYELPSAHASDPQGTQQTGRTILLALDESSVAQYAFEHAKKHLLRPDDCVCIVNVKPVNSPPPLESLDVGAAFIDTGCLDKQSKYHEAHSEWLLHQYEDRLPGHKTRLFSLLGDNRDEICRAAKNLNVDLVVLGSRDMNGLQRFFLGSTSDYCLHSLDCPVMVVKPKAHEIETFKPLLAAAPHTQGHKTS